MPGGGVVKYPSLIAPWACKTYAEIVIMAEGLTEEGASVVAYSGGKYGNYQSGGKTVFDKEQKRVQLTGTICIPGDICPDVPEITSGTIVVHGVKRNIFQGFKRRNPDGTVNYTEIQIV
jgi:hypothetical protein